MLYRLLVVGLFVAALVVSPRAVVAHELCYPDKTPFCFNDPFTDYWENNGGLPVFGYPISAAGYETPSDSSRAYLTQWAERNRFEVHPENAGTPYEILLGLLGKDRLLQLGRDFNAVPREAGPQEGCLWFAQTGHNVCDQAKNVGFKHYWENHGLKIAGLSNFDRSLQLFGLPLTAPTMETNSSGDTVLTQWFERARFEWHPANPDEYKVLLGLLGKEVLGERSTPPEPQPAPPPPSLNNCQADTTVAPNFPITIVALDKAAEIVTIRNLANEAVVIDGWLICSVRGNQIHATLAGSLAAGETRPIPSQAGGNIWSNNDPDDATLYNENGSLISSWDD